MVILYTESLQSKLYLSDFVKNNQDKIDLIIEFPSIPVNENKDAKKKRPLLKKILESSFYFLWFNLIIIKGYKFVSSFYKSSFTHTIKLTSIKCIKANSLTPELLNQIKHLNPEWILNASSIILRENIISIPQNGILNYHCAPLPEFRGAANYFWMLIENCEKAYGTLHLVAKGLDTGDIFSFGPTIDITPKMSVFQLWYRIRESSGDVLQSFLNEAKSIVPQPSKQDNSKSVVRSFPKKNDVKELHKKGFKVFKLSDLKTFLIACK